MLAELGDIHLEEPKGLNFEQRPVVVVDAQVVDQPSAEGEKKAQQDERGQRKEHGQRPRTLGTCLEMLSLVVVSC